MKRYPSIEKKVHSQQRKHHEQRYEMVQHTYRRATGMVGQDRKGERAQREYTKEVEMSNSRWSCFYKDKKFRLCPFSERKLLKDFK